jgi:hypothetical protein
MKTISHVEQEVNQIRLRIYEETKDLTAEQYKERLDKITEAAAQKYGFKVVASAREGSEMERNG